VGHMIADGPGELRRRPKIELQLAEFVVQSRPVNGVDLRQANNRRQNTMSTLADPKDQP
jgi:hypothetical protein